jgi:hypothetical protein
MRRIVNYFRQTFCKHDWIIEEKIIKLEGLLYDKNSERVYMRCKKCGYHQKHWKFI